MVLIRKICSNYGFRAVAVLGLHEYVRYFLVSVREFPRIVAEKSLRPVDRAMSGIVRVKHRLNGTQCLIDLDSYRGGDAEEDSYAFGLVREIWFRDIYFRHFDLPPKLGCVVDLGANRGIFTLQAAAVAEQVIAVEALDKYRASLQHNLALNGLDNVELVHAMVGGQALLDREGNAMIGLDEVVSRARAPVDLLKVDIEGSEFGLDLRAVGGVRRIAMELHPHWGSPAKLVAAVAALGFDCRTFDESMTPVAADRADFLLAINRAHPDARWSTA